MLLYIHYLWICLKKTFTQKSTLWYFIYILTISWIKWSWRTIDILLQYFETARCSGNFNRYDSVRIQKHFPTLTLTLVTIDLTMSLPDESIWIASPVLLLFLLICRYTESNENERCGVIIKCVLKYHCIFSECSTICWAQYYIL